MHRVCHDSTPVAALRASRRVTGLVGAPEDTHTAATKREHFGHERQPIEPSILVERPQDFFPARHLDDFTSSQLSNSGQ